VLALAAAGSVFEIDGTVHRLNVFALSFLGRFCLCFGSCQAASRWLATAKACNR
jgi:hypothetical protein